MVEGNRSGPVSTDAGGRQGDPDPPWYLPDRTETVSLMDEIGIHGRSSRLVGLCLGTQFLSLGDGGGKEELWLN